MFPRGMTLLNDWFALIFKHVRDITNNPTIKLSTFFYKNCTRKSAFDAILYILIFPMVITLFKQVDRDWFSNSLETLLK